MYSLTVSFDVIINYNSRRSSINDSRRDIDITLLLVDRATLLPIRKYYNLRSGMTDCVIIFLETRVCFVSEFKVVTTFVP